ncbi:MAG: glycine cleavage system aminomethyltransferase GcvT [Micromonosporaceae bacterium]
MTDDLRRSSVHDRHVALGVKFASFGGWQMPLEYAGGGVVAEHTAVRQAVGVFDVSHLGKVTVSGPGAAEFLNACLTNDLGRIEPGKAQYTMCCDPASGGVVDDMIAYLHSDDRVFLVPNASNSGEVCRRLAAAAPAGVSVTDQHEQHAVLAVQGPRSTDLLEAVDLPTAHEYMSFVEAPLPAPHPGAAAETLVVCRTGYTGEHGYELVVGADAAAMVWDTLLAAGEDLGVRPCGLGARDTLRTEMGYPLHGQDLSMEITPVQARAGWAVGWKKPRFWGRERLSLEREAGPRRRLRGLEAVERGIPRPGMRVHAGDRQIGEITSGTFSPTRKQGIALALIDSAAGIDDGAEVEVDVRGRRSRMRVVKPPFVTTHVK